MNKHKYEVGEIRKHINTIEQKEKKTVRSNQRPNDISDDEKLDKVFKPIKEPRAMKSNFDSGETTKCAFQVDIDPKPDIQVSNRFC